MFKEHRIVLFATIFSSLMAVSLLVVKVYISLSYIPDISGSETSTIFPIQRLNSGLPIYTNPEEPPFLLTQYTPIYFVIVSVVMNLLGLASEDAHGVFVVSRLISITFTVLSVSIVGMVLYQHTRKNILVAVLGSALVYQILGFWFLTSSRPDSLLVLCTALVVISALKAIDLDGRGTVWWYVALFFAVSAFFVKQSGAVHSIGIGIFLITQRNWKLLGRLICFGILVCAFYLGILPIGSLDLFFLNIVGGVANSMSFAWFYDWTLQKLLFQFAPLLALNFVIVFRSLADKANKKLYFLSICSICFFLFSLLTALKIGAGVGYFQDYLIVAVVLFVLFWVDNWWVVSFKGMLPLTVGCVYLCLVALHCLLFVFKSYTNLPLAIFEGKYVEQREIARFLRAKGLRENDLVYVCGTKDFNGYFLKHFLYGNTLVPFPDLVFLGDRNGTFNFSKLGSLIDKNEIKYVISELDEVPTTILGQKFSKMTKIYSTGNLDVYQGAD